MVRATKGSARVTTRARILLRTGERWTAPRVAEALDVSIRSAFRITRRLAEDGMEEVLRHRNSPNPHWKMGDQAEAYFIALAISPHIMIERAKLGGAFAANCRHVGIGSASRA